MKKLLYLSFLFLAFLCSCSSQKTETIVNLKTVTGYVFSDEDKLPLPGVSIQVKGSEKTRNTTTDLNGKFEIEARKGETLKTYFVGFYDEEIKITDENEYKVYLRDRNVIETGLHYRRR